MKITCLLALFLLCPPLAQALDLCVANDSQFSNALLAATITPGSSTIKLVRGVTFHVPPQFDADSDQSSVTMHDLTIEGGYASGCSDASYQLAPTATVISGAGSNVLAIKALGSLRLSNLSFTEFTSRILVVDLTNTALHVRVTHVRFVDGGGVYFTFYATDSSIDIDNSLFAQQSPQIAPKAALNLSQGITTSGLSVRLTNNTIVANSHHGIASTDGAAVSLFNNIVFGNGGTGDYDLVNTNSVLAIANTIGTHSGTYGLGSNANLTSDPQFVSSTDYNIKLTSPAYDSGTSVVPGGLSAYDIEGEDRVVGGSVDRGAYENNNSGATILLVTNTNDSGPGSLRTAITDANANPVDNIIGFNISGACPRTISVNTELPAITDNLSIRGYTQPGALPNTSSFSDNATICVELVEAAGHTITNGLHFAPTLTSISLDVSGLAIGDFTTGIRIDGPSSVGGASCSIWGSFIGLAADGTTLRANSFTGIDVEGRAYCTIGGNDRAQTNVVAGAFTGIKMATNESNFVVNNFIGTTRSGNTARANVTGVSVYSGLNQILDNVISGNSTNAIMMTGVNGADNSVRGNRIGLKAFAICTPPCAPDFNALPNGGDAILITNASYGNYVIDNTIAFNGGAGVRVFGTGSFINFISGNSIYENNGLGIDLGSVGVDPIDNDATADPASANGSLNAPFLYQSTGGEYSGTVVGYLATRDGRYHIEFFASPSCDPSGHGEGRYFLGMSDVIISGALPGENGLVEFALPIQSTQNLTGMAITAVAIDDDDHYIRSRNTSEFSRCVTHQFLDYIFSNGFEDEGEGG